MLNAEGTNEQTTLQAGSTSETEATGEQEASGEGANDAERRNVAVRQLETSFDLSAVGAGSRGELVYHFYVWRPGVSAEACVSF